MAIPAGFLPLASTQRRVAALAALFSVLAALPAQAAKTDVVVLKNGDRSPARSNSSTAAVCG